MDVSKFSPESIQVLWSARFETEPYGCKMGVEHWFAGLLSKDAVIAQAFSNLSGITLEDVHKAYRKKYGRDNMPERKDSGKCTDGAAKALERAEALAAERGRGARMFPVDIFGGLLESDDPMMAYLLGEGFANIRDAVLEHVRAVVGEVEALTPAG